MPHADFPTVALVTVEENADAFTVGLSETAAGDGARLILQCAVTPPTAQDAATGMDTYCVMDGEGAVQYGAIRVAELGEATLRLRFTAQAAGELAIQDADGLLTLGFPAADRSRLAAALRRVLAYGDPARRPRLRGI